MAKPAIPAQEKTNLVMAGGGFSALAYEAALQEMEAKSILPGIKNVLGCSAGALIGLTLAFGVDKEQRQELVQQMSPEKFGDFKKITDIFKPSNKTNAPDAFRGLIQETIKKNGEALLKNYVENGAPDKQAERQAFIDSIKEKGLEKMTFAQHHELVKDSEGKYPDFYVTLSEVTGLDNLQPGKKNNVGLQKRTASWNDPELKDMPIAAAVYGSMAIPKIFEPSKWNGRTFCDGGMTDNFDITFFDNKQNYTALSQQKKDSGAELVEVGDGGSKAPSRFQRFTEAVKDVARNSFILRKIGGERLAKSPTYLKNEETIGLCAAPAVMKLSNNVVGEWGSDLFNNGLADIYGMVTDVTKLKDTSGNVEEKETQRAVVKHLAREAAPLFAKNAFDPRAIQLPMDVGILEATAIQKPSKFVSQNVQAMGEVDFIEKGFIESEARHSSSPSKFEQVTEKLRPLVRQKLQDMNVAAKEAKDDKEMEKQFDNNAFLAQTPGRWQQLVKNNQPQRER